MLLKVLFVLLEKILQGYMVPTFIGTVPLISWMLLLYCMKEILVDNYLPNGQYVILYYPGNLEEMESQEGIIILS